MSANLRLCSVWFFLAQDLSRIGIDCKMRLSCNWIDTGYGVGHLLPNNVVNLKRIDNTRRSWNKSDQKGSVHKEPY